MKLLSLALGTVLLLFSPHANATVVLDLSGPELAAVSDAIVHARVLRVSAQATPDARVFTTAEIEVIEGLKGASAGTRMKVVYPGGVATGLGMLISGQVALDENSECVIFLTKNDEQSFMPSALTLGFFAIKRRDYDGVRVALRSTRNLTLVRRIKVAGQLQTVIGEPRDVRSPLDVVLSDIRKDMVASKALDRDRILGGGQ